jgi:hypothetical protein
LRITFFARLSSDSTHCKMQPTELNDAVLV